jgi:hypothetical protein
LLGKNKAGNCTRCFACKKKVGNCTGCCVARKVRKQYEVFDLKGKGRKLYEVFWNVPRPLPPPEGFLIVAIYCYLCFALRLLLRAGGIGGWY